MTERLILPIPPSLNHAYENRFIKGRRIRVYSSDAEAFKKECQLKAILWRNRTGWQIPDEDRFVVIRGWFYWETMLHNDTNNRWKILLDSLESILYIDDAMVLECACDAELDRKNPRLELEFELGRRWPAKTKMIEKRRKKKPGGVNLANTGKVSRKIQRTSQHST